MSMERMWDIASTISAIEGLLVSAILVARFYVPYVIKKKSAVPTADRIQKILFFISIFLDSPNYYILLSVVNESIFFTTIITRRHGICEEKRT